MTISLPTVEAASPASVAALVNTYGELPTDYVEFLAAHDGVRPPENMLDGTNNSIGIERFIPAAEILSVASNVDGLSQNLIPVAEDDSGNFICIKADDHKVYFWDHELDKNRVISESFQELLSKLKLFDLSTIQLQPGAITYAW